MINEWPLSIGSNKLLSERHSTDFFLNVRECGPHVPNPRTTLWSKPKLAEPPPGAMKISREDENGFRRILGALKWLAT